MIGASVVLRVRSQFMERHLITQGTIAEFHDCPIFSKLDIKQGYHQLLLTRSRIQKNASFSTSVGEHANVTSYLWSTGITQSLS